jgi:C1A family cysteine protease
MLKGLGWQPDIRDERDELFAAQAPLAAAPAVYSMLEHMPPVYDQGNLGSCTANSVAGGLQYTEKEMSNWSLRPVPSRLFIYYNTRQLQGTIKSDSGASIRNSIKAVARWGYCPETADLGTAYRTSDFKKTPPAKAYKAAAKHLLATVGYARVGDPRTGMATVAQIKAAVGERNPVTFGFTVYESFSDAGRTGICPMPKRGEGVEGGHAVLIIGWDDAKKAWLCRNSWGPKWGSEGHFWMPYEFQMQHAQDYWVVKLVPALEVAA